jgi:GntR family transcriptional regulator, transcriptional repressor for pyruvate dehydrogenase complex
VADIDLGATAKATNDGRLRGRRTEKVAESVAREILQDIVERGLTPGSRLPPEAQMLTTYEVGRASLREALRILEIQGLIQIKPGPGGGPIVAGVRSQDFGKTATMYFHASGARFRELVEARLVVEPMMAAVAARRQDRASIEQLQAVVKRASETQPEDVPAYSSAALDFHSLVAGMSGNRILDLIGRSLKDIFSERLRELVFQPEERERILKAHQRIAQAITSGNAKRAEQLMRTHMEEFLAMAELRFPGLMEEVVDWR